MTTMVVTRRELDYLIAERIDQFRPRKFRSILQIDRSAPGWAERVEVQRVERFGDIRPTVSGGSDGARAPTLRRSNSFLNIWEFEGYYEIRDSELERVAALGGSDLSPLPVKLAAANQEKAEIILDEIAAIGSSARTADGWPTIPGLANNADAISAVLAASGNWTDSTDTKSILNDLHSCVQSVYSSSKEIFEADTLVLPLTRYLFIQRKRLGDGTDKTVLSAFREESSVTRIMPWARLETAGVGAVKRMIAYDSKHPSAPRMLISRELTDHEPARKRLGFEVGQTMRTAGVLIENHLAMQYTDGI